MRSDNYEASDLPEVVDTTEQKIAIPRDAEAPQAYPGESEGKQVLHQDWDKDRLTTDERQDWNKEHLATHGGVSSREAPVRKSLRAKYKCVILGFVLGCTILPIALGVGLGVGLRSNNNPPGCAQDCYSATESCSQYYNRTGQACSSCKQNETYNATVSPVTLAQTFTQVCDTDMRAGSVTYNQTANNTTTTVQDLISYISNSFEDCINHCAIYNQVYGNSSVQYPCQGVTHFAITARKNEDDCYLKSARGAGTVNGTADSAYLDGM